MRHLLPFLLLSLLIGLRNDVSAADQAVKPNFVIINVDDLGYGDIGPFNPECRSRTPHLDQMAREGRKLTSHYGAPVCSPSRAALMTGCYPKRALPIPHVLFPSASVGLNPDEVTVAEVLKEAGYATACIGKWHLGDQPQFLPTRQGFDYYFGIPYSNDMGPPEDGSKSNPGQPLPKRPANAKAGGQAETGVTGLAQPPLPLLKNEKVIERVLAEGQATVTRRYTEQAQQFIRAHRDQPFFVYLPHTAVHFPLYPSAEFLKAEPTRENLLKAWVEEVDWSVGQVLATLRELNLDERTLVLFTSDNGGSVPHASDNRPLRGSKGSTLEGGLRVSTIARWTGRIPAGTTTDHITSMMDILPTFAALAGAKLPDGRKLDGVDLSSTLFESPEQKPARDHFYYFRGFTLEAVRSGPWKLHLKSGELYHLGDDIGEAKNVAAGQPEVVAHLRQMAEAMKEDLGVEGIGAGCRPLGRVEDPQPLINAEGRIRAGFEP